MIQKVLELIESDKTKYSNDSIPYYDSSEYVLDIIDDLLLDGNFEKPNEYLKEAIPHIKNFPIIIMLMYLSATNFPGNSLKLPNRKYFYNECERVLKIDEPPERVRNLLQGLRDQD